MLQLYRHPHLLPLHPLSLLRHQFHLCHPFIPCNIIFYQVHHPLVPLLFPLRCQDCLLLILLQEKPLIVAGDLLCLMTTAILLLRHLPLT